MIKKKIQSISKINKNYLILLIILFLNLFLNIYGITWGLPSLWYPDEPETIEKIIIPMAKNFDLNPHLFYKTSFYYYFLLFFLSPYFIFLKVFGIGFEPYIKFVGNTALIARLLSAATGTFGVYLAYRIGENIRNRRTGIIAALLLAVNIGYVAFSHFAMMEILLLVEVLLLIYLFFKYTDSGDKKILYWISFLSGLSISTKYNAGLFIVVVLLLVHCLRIQKALPEKNKKYRIFRLLFRKPLFYSGGLVITGFIAGTPYSILDYKTFSSFIIMQSFFTKGYGLIRSAFTWQNNFNFLKDGFGTPLFYLIMAALIYTFIRILLYKKIKEIFLFIIPLLYFLYIGSWDISAFRYLLILYPFLILTGAFFINDIYEKGNDVTKSVSIIIILIIFYTFGYTLNGILAFTSDTRETAGRWIEKNIPSDSDVEFYSFTTYLPRFPESINLRPVHPDFIPNSEEFEEFKKSELGKKIIDEEVGFSEQGINKNKFFPEELQKRNPDYIVLSSFFYGRFLYHKESAADDKYNFIRDYFTNLIDEKYGYKLIKKFEKDNYMRSMALNPNILILKKSVNEIK